MIHKKKLAKCTVCKVTFEKRSMSHKACKPECAQELAKRCRDRADRKAAKLDREDTAKRKEALKSKSDHMREAQAELNKWVRLVRDRDLPCISCGKFHQGQWHAGHYLSRGAHPELALNRLNVHKQCQPCNVHLSGNQINYRIGLIARIGIVLVEWLESYHDPVKLSIDDIKAVRNEYRTKTNTAQK
jgi:hypothetical protein